jgi:methylglutaconyl-CoA hydratase
MWRNAEWAKKKGLYSELYASAEDMDESIQRLSYNLAHSNPQAMAEMKKMLWHGTENWDQLLLQRAIISGKLVLGQHTRSAIEKFKAKVK